MTTTTDRSVATSPTTPSTPRLQMQAAGAGRTLLDGGWWPRSTDPIAELPGLVLAINGLRGPVTRLVLSSQDWGSQTHRMRVGDRVLRLGYFTSQPAGLLTAICDNGDRIDLLVVAPETKPDIAEAAMQLAATADNLVHAQNIVDHLDSPRPTGAAGQES